jgi:type III secretion protein L
MTAEAAGPGPRPPRPALRPPGPVIPAAEAGLWTDAAAALAGADAYAERTRRWARAAYVQARERGLAEGRAEGGAQAARLVASAQAQVSQLLRAVEGRLPDLVADLVGSVLGSFDPGEILPHAVREAVRQLDGAGEVRVRVAPDLAEPLRLALEGETGPRIRVEADPGLEGGACVLWSEVGNVELTIAAQLKALRDGLRTATAPAGDAP